MKVFVHGQYGTAGIRLFDLLKKHPVVELISLKEEERRNPDSISACIEEADAVALCLPSKEVPEIISTASPATRILDCGSQMRLHPDWVYGLPELGSSQRSQISMANRVANPGCFAAAFILLVHPLVDSGVLSSDQIIHAFGITGYSAGGKRMISDYETNGKSGAVHSLRRTHRHVPEMRQFSGLLNSPSFVASVGGHKEGLILTIPLPGYPRRSLTSVLQDAYQSETLASFIGECPNTLSPVSFKGNQIEIFVGGSDNHCTLAARMSNLLKGAATTAVQNLNLMLSLDEFTGLK